RGQCGKLPDSTKRHVSSTKFLPCKIIEAERVEVGVEQTEVALASGFRIGHRCAIAYASTWEHSTNHSSFVCSSRDPPVGQAPTDFSLIRVNLVPGIFLRYPVARQRCELRIALLLYRHVARVAVLGVGGEAM